MALDKPDLGRFALSRYGLGVRAGMAETEMAAIGRDPVGALMADLDAIPPFPALPDSAERALDWRDLQDEKKLARDRKKAEANMLARMERSTSLPAMVTDSERKGETRDDIQAIVRAEQRVRFEQAMKPALGFHERLVWFWSNHFCVSQNKGGMLRVLPGPYEREAIRPFVAGSFRSMLFASAMHPAMLFYLDNNRSVGPGSIAGQNQERGLNENLAREILELHTLGVRSVYSQDDVTAFAKAITGWSYGNADDEDRAFRFLFRARTHEPGPKKVLGKRYDAGFDGGKAILADLARHRATARHVAHKLAVHFIADMPDEGLVEAMAKAFLASEGDLKAVYRAMLTHKAAFDGFGAKLRQPIEWLVAFHRGFDLPMEEPRMNYWLSLLGQPLWRVASPKGYADENAPWMDDIARRVDVAQFMARSLKGLGSPLPHVAHVLGPQAKETLEAVRRAESPAQGFTLAFMSPDFLRR